MPSSALVVLRRGDELVYIHDRAIAATYKSAESRNVMPASLPTPMGDQYVLKELLRFEGEFVELVNNITCGGFTTPGLALAAIKPMVKPELATAVCNLFRSRGATAHPVPAGKCARILQEVQDSICGHIGTSRVGARAWSSSFGLCKESVVPARKKLTMDVGICKQSLSPRDVDLPLPSTHASAVLQPEPVSMSSQIAILAAAGDLGPSAFEDGLALPKDCL